MARRPQQHLREVVDQYDGAPDPAGIALLLERGLWAARDAEQAARLADRGTLDKLNPHISDAGKCPRQVFLSLRNVPETDPLTADSLVNFGIGHAVEEWFANILMAQGAEILREVRVEIPAGNTKVSGRSDFLVRLPYGQRQVLIELKSASSRSMSFGIKKGEQGKDDHRRQLNLYLHASQLGLLPEGWGPFDEGYLVYGVKDATKGEPPFFPYLVAYDEDLALNDLRNLAQLHAVAKLGGDIPIPDESYTKRKFPCGWCSYATHCHG
jgi:hypothetical protein